MTQRYIVTCAQNATPVFKPAMRSFETWAKAHKAEICVIRNRYRNPTSIWSDADTGDDWWAEEVTPYLVGRKTVSRNLRIIGDVSIQPTAVRPLSGFEVYAGETSCIFGHPRRALEVVPTATRNPKIFWTTGSVTKPNYTKSKAGAKAKAHHVYGAVIVEVEKDGTYFCRDVTCDSKGRFIDLGVRWSEDGPERVRTLTLTEGDSHTHYADPALERAKDRLYAELSPEWAVVHDVHDMFSRNHHIRTHREWFDRHPYLVEDEVEKTAAHLTRRAGQASKGVKVVRSNHDEHFERWLDEHRRDRDPQNDPYFCRAWARAYDYRAKNGSWPNMLELECRRLGVPKNVDFLTRPGGRNGSFKVKGVEHGFHTDKGINGARGSIMSYVRLGVKATGGHGHTPWTRDGFRRVGVGAGLDHGYNDLPSTWVQADVALYEDGHRQTIIYVNGRYKAK